jgi:hypothetical protein
VPPLVALQSELPASPKVTRWLYAGDDTAWRLRAERGALAHLQRIESADALQNAALRLRRPFIDWIGTLSAANDSLEWWASELAAKNSYSMFFDRICSLAAAVELAAEDNTLVVCSTPALATEVARCLGAPVPVRPGLTAPARSGRRALRAWARLAPRALMSLPGRLSERERLILDSDPRYRMRVLKRAGAGRLGDFSGPDTFLLFTWVDARSFDGKAYVDPHVGMLAELLRDRGMRVAFVPRVLPSMPFDDAVPKLVASGETFVFPDTYVDLDSQRACAAEATSFRFRILDESTIDGIPVAALARELTEVARPSQVRALSVAALIRALADGGVRPERIVHTYEGHNWELALAYAARQHLPETKIVGYENVNMSRLALSMYPASNELGRRPLPDRIVTNGPAFHEVLVDEGMPARLVTTGCGLRHAYLWEKLPEPSPRTGRRFRILVATDATFGPAAEIVQKAAEAFGADPDVDVIVKCHPLLREADVRAFAPDLHYTQERIRDLLADADAVLYAYSAVGYEALAHGVPPVFVRAETTLDLDQLEPFQDLRWEGRTPAELRDAVSQIASLDDAERAAWRERGRAAAARAFAPPNPACVEAFFA